MRRTKTPDRAAHLAGSEPADAARPGDPRRSRWWIGAVVGGWLALVALAIVWGEHVVAVGDRLRMHAPPLTADYKTRAGAIVLAPIAVSLLVIAYGPRLSRTLSWRALLGAAMVITVVWAIVLGLNDGWRGLTDPLVRSNQYLATVPRVGDPLQFLQTFAARLPTYNIHTQGHPPGMVMVLWSFDRLGLGGGGFNLLLVLAGGAASVAAVMIAARDVAGEAAARAAAPFLVLAPAAIWWSSGDAFFAGVSAWAVTLTVLATSREGRDADWLALGGGLLFGFSVLLSYGLVLMAIIPVVVAVARRRARPIVIAACGAVLPLLVFWAAGFWWFAGLSATNARYWAGVASRRPYEYFILGNLAAFALAIGPAGAAGLVFLRDRRLWLLVGGVLAVVALADLSGMSKGEVERIWLPFVPWTLLAAGALASRTPKRVPAWLLGQATVAIAIQVVVRTSW